MKILEVHYSKKFPYAPYLNEDIGFVASVDGDDVQDVLARLKGMATRFYEESNPHLKNEPAPISNAYPSFYEKSQSIPEQQVEKTSRESIIEGFKRDIHNCSTIESLNGYKILAETYPELSSVYEKRRQQIIGENFFK